MLQLDNILFKYQNKNWLENLISYHKDWLYQIKNQMKLLYFINKLLENKIY